MEKKIEKVSEKALEDYGSYWAKYGKERYYFNAKDAEAIGLELSYYKTGNISSAHLNGEKISNAQGKRIRETIEGSFYDVKSGKYVAKNVEDEEAFELFAKFLEEK